MPDATAIFSSPSSDCTKPKIAGASPTVAILAVYFGVLPYYFPLWLESCSRNPDFHWFVLTDADKSSYTLPPNVHWRATTLAEFGNRMSSALGIEMKPASPYKVCDFRPAFSILLDREPARWDFWGHCDFDMIFGDLRKFITAEILSNADKIFTLGHLTLYRNSKFVNEMFRRQHPRLDWRAILADPAHRGFDEHIGVGLIWRAHRDRIFKDESIVADIDPGIGRFERSAPYRNDRHQVFYYDRGRVFRVFWRGERGSREEFMYIHFQKRKAMHLAAANGTESYVIGPDGFFACSPDELSRDLARRLNPFRWSWKETLHRWRCAIRSFRRKRGFVGDFRGPYR